MALLTFHGGYFRYEVQQIEEDEAQIYLESGIDESDLFDLDFSDEAEQGLAGEVIVLLDETKITEFALESVEKVEVERAPSYWHLLRLEQGRQRTSYAVEIASTFDESKINIHACLKQVGDDQYRFYTPSYGDDSAEQSSEQIDEVSFFIVSPTGEATPLEIN
jgi:hypothetical protein